MSKHYRVGELRPSQILFTYGIGAVVDLPNIAAMVMGLEEWDRPRSIKLVEERLLLDVKAQLGSQVQDLLSPPLPPETEAWAAGNLPPLIGLPLAPFPTWLVCPNCRLLAPLSSGVFDLKANQFRFADTRYVHTSCTKSQKSQNPPTAIPARFLVACDRGHLDNFPWRYFVHRGNSNCQGSLRFSDSGISGAAAEIFVRCDGCGQKRPLSDAFGQKGQQAMPTCRGRHPHLRSFDDHCDRQMKAILLGASNSWFSVTRSAISIPSGSTQLAQRVEKNWGMLAKVTDLNQLTFLLETLQPMGQLQDFIGYGAAEIYALIEQKKQGQPEADPTDLKTPEWRMFQAADPTQNTDDFQLTSTDPPQGFDAYFTKTVLVEKLREVRALIAFTRIQAQGDLSDEEDQIDRVSLGRSQPTWVPASEIRGEGIFLEFKEDAIAAWERQAPVKQRQGLATNRWRDWWSQRQRDPDRITTPDLRYWLIHSFSHALMRQLALECGYGAASLRERIYCQGANAENGPQAGLLIYTATPDSEGTLGGLVHLGQPERLGSYVRQAMTALQLCTSDPLCSDHDPTEDGSLHWAACHACLFAPETSCESGNRLLDRALLVPTLHDETHALAFFDHA